MVEAKKQKQKQKGWNNKWNSQKGHRTFKIVRDNLEELLILPFLIIFSSYRLDYFLFGLDYKLSSAQVKHRLS